MDATLAAIIGAAMGAGVSGAFSLLSSYFQRQTEERRQIRELAVKIALENWQTAHSLAKGSRATVDPVDAYILHAHSLAVALGGNITTTDDARTHLRRALEI